MPVRSFVLHAIFDDVFTTKPTFTLGGGEIVRWLWWMTMGLHPLFNMIEMLPSRVGRGASLIHFTKLGWSGFAAHERCIHPEGM